MYDTIVTYITAIAPSLATVVTAVLMFIKIVTSVRGMVSDLSKKTGDDRDAMRKELEAVRAELADVNNNAEIQQLKELYARACADMEEANRLNAELLAKLNQR